ncbi:MAG: NAD(P)H-quinone oxidoreductase [Hyphomicrobiales bacterium]
MKVIEITTPGAADVLAMSEREKPSITANEVLVKVSAAGVNGPDLVQRRGHYPPPKGASDLLGLEISGEIVECGADVSEWKVGDKICALTNGGGYAEYVAVNAGHCLPIPDGISGIDAAGLPETYFTVWSNIFMGYDIPEGINFLIHGGAGGIGTSAIQLGAALGLNVFTTVSSDENAAFCKELGAHTTINYRDNDFVEVVKEAGGAHIILDIVGGDYIARNIKAARADGRIVQLAFNQGSKVEINLMPIMLKRLTFTGSTLRSRSDASKAAITKSVREQVWPLFNQSKLRPVTGVTLPLEEASKAHAMMEAGGHKGKIILTL